MTDANTLAAARRWHADIYLRGDMRAAEEICADDMTAHGTGVAADAPRGPRQRQDRRVLEPVRPTLTRTTNRRSLPPALSD
jgi:hypothetical protein